MFFKKSTNIQIYRNIYNKQHNSYPTGKVIKAATRHLTYATSYDSAEAS